MNATCQRKCMRKFEVIQINEKKNELIQKQTRSKVNMFLAYIYKVRLQNHKRNLLILLFSLRQQFQTMSSTEIKVSEQPRLKTESKFKSSDVGLNAEILRLQTVACLKQISNIWFLDQQKICTFFQRYNKLPLSRIEPIHLFEAEGARIIKNENKIYLGQILNKKKHGKGIIVYKDGRIYEGEFHENQKSGFGCELYSNGNLYIGYFSQNKKHGKGSFYWFSICTPACTKEASAKIQQYHGDWWGGLPDGQGQHQKANGDFYIGGFKNGLKHGKGSEYYGNGDIYKGQFINGLAEGFGQYQWIDGSNFKGDFKQGYRNGYGVWQSKGGKQQYKGHYLLDRKHGYGIYDWGNNTIYKGQYMEDLRSGQGELYTNGQLVYQGLWQNGERAQMFNSKMTPPKKVAFKSNEKLYTKSSGNNSSHFRVKQSKIQFKSVGRNLSAATVKKDNFQVNFRIDSRISTHRGCQACIKRPATGEYSQKFRRKTQFQIQNPEDCFH